MGMKLFFEDDPILEFLARHLVPLIVLFLLTLPALIFHSLATLYYWFVVGFIYFLLMLFFVLGFSDISIDAWKEGKPKIAVLFRKIGVILIFLLLFLIGLWFSFTSIMAGVPVWNAAIPSISSPEVIAAAADACQEPFDLVETSLPDSLSDHSALLMNQSGNRYWWNLLLPRNWKARTVDELQYVICVAEMRETVVSSCSYWGGRVARIQYALPYQLVSVASGEVLHEGMVEGSMPRKCRDSESASLEKITGSKVDFSDVRRDIQSILK